MGRVGFFGTAPLLFILYHCKLPLFGRELNALHCSYKIIHTYKIKIDHITVGTERFTKCKIKFIQTATCCSVTFFVIQLFLLEVVFI